MAKPILDIKGLEVTVEGKTVVNGLDLALEPGQVHAVMGPNGSGKSTLAYALAGHPNYAVTGGTVRYRGADLLAEDPDERARAGLFLAFQYPMAVPGLSMESFLKSAVEAVRGEGAAGDVFEFHRSLLKEMRYLGIDESFAHRYVNDGFSGGEKKRAEILQMLMLRPTLAVMDETDSGLDIDAVKVVAKGVNRLVEDGMTVLLITHYQRILDFIEPDRVHVLHRGKIARSGGPELALELEQEGYAQFEGPLSLLEAN